MTEPKTRGQTPSQTVGPYFAYGLTPEQYNYPLAQIAGGSAVDEETEGERIRIVGQVFDGEGQPIGDAMIETWQADAKGRYAHPADPNRPNAAFTGFARMGTGTDPQKRFIFETVKPGGRDGQAPHVNVIVMMRGTYVPGSMSKAFSMIRKSRSTGIKVGSLGWTTNIPIMPIAIWVISSACG